MYIQKHLLNLITLSTTNELSLRDKQIL